jgi:hypothetical protein
MKIYSTAEELREELKTVNPSKIAVAYIGKGWEKFLPPDSLKEIILSPTVGSNPYAIRQVIDKLGIKNVHFLDSLHAKIYIGAKSALLGSCNLSNNGFSDNGNFEIGTIFSEKEDLERLNEIFDAYRTVAKKWYPDPDSKKERLEKLYEQWQKSKENVTDSPLANSGEEDAPLLSDWKPDKFERIHIAWYCDGIPVHDKKAVDDAAQQDDVISDNFEQNSFLKRDVGNIDNGHWILNWKCRDDGLPNKSCNPTWLYVHRVISNGITGVISKGITEATATDYTTLAIQWESKDCPPKPFKLDSLTIELFRALIAEDEFKQLRPPENEDDSWSLSDADKVALKFLADLQSIYIENVVTSSVG